jgi:hypothetical protein
MAHEWGPLRGLVVEGGSILRLRFPWWLEQTIGAWVAPAGPCCTLARQSSPTAHKSRGLGW